MEKEKVIKLLESYGFTPTQISHYKYEKTERDNLHLDVIFCTNNHFRIWKNKSVAYDFINTEELEALLCDLNVSKSKPKSHSIADFLELGGFTGNAIYIPARYSDAKLAKFEADCRRLLSGD